MTGAHSVIIIISLEGSLGDGGMEGEKKKKGEGRRVGTVKEHRWKEQRAGGTEWVVIMCI